MLTYASTCSQAGTRFEAHAHKYWMTVDGNNSAPLSTASAMYACDFFVYPLAHPHCNIGKGRSRVVFDERKQFCTTLPLTNIAKREGEGEMHYTHAALVMCVFRQRHGKWCRIVSVDRLKVEFFVSHMCCSDLFHIVADMGIAVKACIHACRHTRSFTHQHVAMWQHDMHDVASSVLVLQELFSLFTSRSSQFRLGYSRKGLPGDRRRVVGDSWGIVRGVVSGSAGVVGGVSGSRRGSWGKSKGGRRGVARVVWGVCM